MSQAAQFLPRIINAKTEGEAVTILKDMLKVLNISSDYTSLNNLKHKMDEFSKEHETIEEHFRTLELPRTFEDVHEVRLELTFLYRRISDELSFEVNKNKIYWEEVKTVKRARAMLELADDDEFQSKIKAKSASALRDVYGASEEMVNYSNMYALAYGLYQRLNTMLTSVKSTMDVLASEERALLNIEANRTQ